MPRIYIKMFGFLMLLLTSFTAMSDNKIDLFTASKDGDYHAVGKAIEKLLTSKGLSVNVHTSQGSVDNFDKMLAGEADLVLIQSDVLYEESRNIKGNIGSFAALFPEYIQTLVNKDNNKIGSIAALFPEYIQILVKEDSKINKVLKLSGKKLYIGENKSGSHKNALEILKQYNIGIKDFTKKEYESGLTQAKQALLKGDIDAIIMTSGNINTDPQFKLIGFDKEFVAKLTIDTPYYSHVLYKTGFNPEYLVYIRAVLAVRYQDGQAGLPDDVVSKLTQTIYENWFEIEKNVDKNLEFFSRHLIARKVSVDLHSAAKAYYIQEGVLANVGSDYIVASSFLALVIIIIAIRQWGMEWRWVNRLIKSSPIRGLYQGHTKTCWDILLRFTTSHGWQMLMWVFIFVVVADLFIISYFEKSHAHEYDTVNPFAEKGIWGILFWLLTFAVTGFNQDIFPNSNIAKISSVIIPILAVLGAFFIVIHQSIQKDRYNEKQLKGEVTPNLNNHIIICGWNNRVPAIIRNLLSQSAPDLSHKILVVAEVDEEKPLEKYGLDKRKVHFYRGISSSHKVLQAADIERSFCSIIVADDKKVQQGNFRSVFTASAIRELTKKKEYYPIIAEVFYQDNIHYFKDYDVQRLLCLKSYTIRFLSHAIINPGVSDILLNLLAFDPPYQLAKVSAQKYGIDKKTYAASVELLRKKDILLLGVYQESKGIVHDPLELEFREDSPYFTNPIPGELETTIAMDDHLIILKNVPGGHSDNDSIQQKELFTAVNCNQETILVIGGHDIATNLCAQISNKVNRVIQLKLNEAEPWTYDDDVFHLDKGSNFDIYETNNLLSILNDTRAPLMDVTRILALTPNPKVNNHLSSVYQDDEVLKIITILKHHFKDKQQAAPHIAAEIKDMSNKELFYYANVNQLVPTNQLIEHVISRMVFHSGKVSGFILKAMSYHQNNKLVRIEKWAAHKLVQKVDRPLIGSTYDEILLYCLPKGIQLMAIETTTETGSKDVIINPDTKSSDSTRGLDLADKVFVLVRTQH